MDETTQPVHRLVGVYDADGTNLGELAYWVGARLGRRHCALCDITHGLFRERDDWRECHAQIPLPFDLVHRNDQPAAIRAAAGSQAPVVVAETSRGAELLLGPDEIEACQGDPGRLVDALEQAVRGADLEWPAA